MDFARQMTPVRILTLIHLMFVGPGLDNANSIPEPDATAPACGLV